MKKLKLLLLLLMLFMAAGMRAAVNGDIFTVGEFSYVITDVNRHTVDLAGCSHSGAVTLPLNVVDKNHISWSVKGVSWQGTYGNVTSITIPEGYERLDINSFSGSKITTIHIPASVTYIALGVFRKCPNLQSITVAAGNSNYIAENGVLYSDNKTKLLFYPSGKKDATFVVPDGVKTIISEAFYSNSFIKDLTLPVSFANFDYVDSGADIGRGSIVGCENLDNIHVKTGNTTFKEIDGVVFSSDGTKLVLYPCGNNRTSYNVPTTVTNIERSAFTYTSGLANIVLPSNLANIGSYAFMHSGITTITLPAALTSLGVGAFAGCGRLTAVNVDANNPTYSSVGGVVFNKAVTELLYYPTGKPGDYVVPGTVITIKKSSCQETKKLNKMTLPPSVKLIETSAFEESSITELAFQGTSGLEKIEERAFCWANLASVRIPASVREICRLAFYEQGRKNLLKSVVVEDGSQLFIIGDGAFVSNRGLESFTFEGTCALTKIGDRVFRNDALLKSFEFPQSVTVVGEGAFNGCTSMAKAVFKEPAALETIGAGAFQNCGLESLAVPSKVKRIEQSAFNNCTELQQIDIPAATEFVDPRAFQFCTSLTAFKVARDNTVYSSIDGVLLSKDKETLKVFPPGKANDEFTLLPPSITSIGEYSFYHCMNLKNVTIPNKVAKIEKAAFQLCENMNTITFLCDAMIDPNNIAQGGNDRAFDDGTNGSKNMFNLINIFVRENIASHYVGNAFYGKFHSIGTSFNEGKEEYIPVSELAVDLLSTTTTDYTYVLPKSVTHADKAYKVALIGDYAFQNVSNAVKEVVVKDNVRYIGAKAFMTDINGLSSTIENVFFTEKAPTKEMLSTARFELDETGKNYNEFAASTKIYVKKSALDTYRNVWKKSVYDIPTGSMKKSQFDFTSQIGYKIPDVKIAKKYGTFAREFDTDFSDYFTTNGNTDVAAFVAGSSILPGGGDYGTSTYHVKMWSIDVKGGVNGNYGYVPAYTGVLLKVLDKESTPSDFYYTIGEQDNRTYNVSDNIMHGITVRNERVEASATEPVYVMQGGVFRKATADIGSFSVHKAYMKPGTLPAGAKVMLVFDDTESSATGIETVVETGARKEDNVYYNLNGQRVDNPRHGVYIRNGKKVIIK